MLEFVAMSSYIMLANTTVYSFTNEYLLHANNADWFTISFREKVSFSLFVLKHPAFFINLSCLRQKKIIIIMMVMMITIIIIILLNSQ